MRNSRAQQLLVEEKEEEAQSSLPENIRRPATESLVHTKLIAEGLFDVSRSSGGRGNPVSPFDEYAAKLSPVKGRKRDDPQRAPDAFDVGVCCLRCVYESCRILARVRFSSCARVTAIFFWQFSSDQNSALYVRGAVHTTSPGGGFPPAVETVSLKGYRGCQ